MVMIISVLALRNGRINLIHVFTASENELKLASKTLKTREVVDGKGRNVKLLLYYVTIKKNRNLLKHQHKLAGKHCY